MNVAIIPARGGSKRIPRKNIKDFSGKPLIAYSIIAALETSVFDRVIVSTDDKEIAEVCRRFGAEIPFVRPESISDDYTGTTEVVSHAVQWLQDNGQVPEKICCIYATAPFIKKEDIIQGNSIMDSGDWQYVFSATEFVYPVFRAFKNNRDKGLEMIFPDHFATRSQDLSPVYHDAGQFYWGRSEAWLNNLMIFQNHSTVVELPSWRVQDIDTPEDWTRAELIFRILNMQDNQKEKIDHYLKIIDEIEKVRSRNNVNWMDILRLAFKNAPEEAKELMLKVNTEDDKVSALLKKLAEE